MDPRAICFSSDEINLALRALEVDYLSGIVIFVELLSSAKHMFLEYTIHLLTSFM